jgi:hypothetical protein
LTPLRSRISALSSSSLSIGRPDAAISSLIREYWSISLVEFFGERCCNYRELTPLRLGGTQYGDGLRVTLNDYFRAGLDAIQRSVDVTRHSCDSALNLPKSLSAAQPDAKNPALCQLPPAGSLQLFFMPYSKLGGSTILRSIWPSWCIYLGNLWTIYFEIGT